MLIFTPILEVFGAHFAGFDNIKIKKYNIISATLGGAGSTGSPRYGIRMIQHHW